MFSFSKFCLVATLAVSVAASPVLVDRADASVILTGQWDTHVVTNKNYVIENNLWGAKSPGVTGWQTTTVDTTSSDVVWSTSYQWAGNNNGVKSYANAARATNLGQQLSSITSIPTQWKWHYPSASSNLVADVSWDLWLSPEANGSGASPSSSYEIMIWLSARGGAGPAGSQVATAHIHGAQWKLFKGTVSTWTVYSFVAPEEYQNYKGNLLPFFTYLIQSQGLPSNHYFVQAQAGTEPFVGSATLQTTSYSMNVHHK
ncbi:hypothetical protein HKX48_004943 [Thoreauomyces humboldtii]|nr:hypothetical protein HKX48_004943 [Thoreauomyces humboldtii]